MDESQKVAHCSKKSMQISLNKIGIMQKGTKLFTENQISAIFFLMKWVGMCLIWCPLSENYTNTKTLLYARLIFDQPFSLKEFKGKWEQRPFFRQEEESQIHTKGQINFLPFAG